MTAALALILVFSLAARGGEDTPAADEILFELPEGYQMMSM